MSNPKLATCFHLIRRHYEDGVPQIKLRDEAGLNEDGEPVSRARVGQMINEGLTALRDEAQRRGIRLGDL